MKKQNEIEQVIKYQKQTLDYLGKWLTEEIERDKKEFPDRSQAEEEGILPGDLEEAMDAELQIDADADKKLEEGLVHEEDLESFDSLEDLEKENK